MNITSVNFSWHRILIFLSHSSWWWFFLLLFPLLFFHRDIQLSTNTSLAISWSYCVHPFCIQNSSSLANATHFQPSQKTKSKSVQKNTNETQNYACAYQIVSSNISSFKEMFKALRYVTKSISGCKFHNKNKSVLITNRKEGVKPFWTLKVVCSFPPTKTNELIDIYEN